jgi:membrane associated rhomboid family serine protease
MIPISDRIPTHRFPIITILLILANVLAFGYQLMLQSAGGDRLLFAFIQEYGVVPARVADGLDGGTLFSFVTAMFLHGGLLHIAGNMLYLWVFGNNIEDILGHFWFTVFYFATGFAASITQVMVSWGSTVPGIGASGAIAGVLAAYLLFFPRSRVNTLLIFGFLIMVRALPAILVLGLWFLIQVVQGFLGWGQTQEGGVAFFAHIGGFVAGFILALPWVGRARRVGARVIY